jgi:hypothetical protein
MGAIVMVVVGLGELRKATITSVSVGDVETQTYRPQARSVTAEVSMLS